MLRDELDHDLTAISRKFVHKNDNLGYKSFDLLLEDFDAVVAKLPKDPSMSEYWIRAADDLASYMENWGTDIDDEAVIESLKNFSDELNSFLEEFTMTQKMRLRSIAMRTRLFLSQVSDDPACFDIYSRVLTDTGSALHLS